MKNILPSAIALSILILASCAQSPTPDVTETKTPVQPVAVATTTPSPVQASPDIVITPETVRVKPLTDAEQFKQVVLSKTDGLFAQERVQNMPPDEMYTHSRELLDLINQGVNGGLSLERVKQMFADQLHIQQGLDEKLSANLSNGLIEGTLAWERGERPINTETTQPTVATSAQQTGNITPSQSEQRAVPGQMGVLTAASDTARINLRSEPSSDVPTRRYGLVGDRIIVQDSAVDSNGNTWYKVEFQESKAVGWIRSDFVGF